MHTYKKFLIISILIIGTLFAYNVLAIAPTVDVYAVQTSIGYGESTIVGWSAINATGGCVGFGGVWPPNTEGLSGNMSTGSLTRSKTYTIRCADDLGNLVTDSVTVNVAPAPSLIVSLSASPTSVTSGNSSTLTWSSAGFTDCVASGDWSGAKTTSGSESTGNLTSAKTYTIGCYIADACLPSLGNTSLWTDNHPPSTNLGMSSVWCASKTSKTACDGARASPGGTDPVQYVCEWTPASVSVSKTATVSVNTPPPTPTGFEIIPGCERIDVKWNASAGATSYQLYRDGTIRYNGSNLEYPDTSVGTTTHTYYVTATSSSGVVSAPSITHATAARPLSSPLCLTPSLNLLADPLVVAKNNPDQSSEVAAYKTNVQMGTVNFSKNVPPTSGLTVNIPPDPSTESASVAKGNLTVGAGTATAARYQITVTGTGTGTNYNSVSDSVSVPVDVVSGTLTATSCVIASGASTCNSTITWSTQNPQGIVAVTSDTNSTGGSAPNTVVAVGNPGSQSIPIFYPSRKLYLYNYGLRLNQVDVAPTATCASGTSWNGTICSPIASAPTITSPTASCISTTSALLGATMTSTGGSNITAYGICYVKDNPSILPSLGNSTCQTTTGSWNAGFTFAYNIGSLSAGSTYYFRGYASNSVGTSYTPQYSYSSFNCSAPPTPTGLTATPAACGTGRIDLSWTASSGAASYKVKQDGTILSTDFTATSTAISGLANGSSHTFSVAAKGSSGVVSAFSSNVSATAPPACSGGTVSGTLTPSPYSCEIPVGSSGCYVDINWNTIFP
ncbi:MAG: hypothetical protein WC447_02890 [Candidatus Paceibacterota bacterium]